MDAPSKVTGTVTANKLFGNPARPPINTMKRRKSKIITQELADTIRAEYKADFSITQMALARKYNLPHCTARRIVLNEILPQKGYKVPTNTVERGGNGMGHWSYYEKRTDDRMSDEYPFHCDTCGMGYDDSNDATDCCARAREYVPAERPYQNKYDNKKKSVGEINQKYARLCDWANRGNW